MRLTRGDHRRSRGRVLPNWEGVAAGQRVLVEHPDPTARDILQRRLEDHGYRVVTCPGPDDRSPCPLVAHEPCPGVDGADAIICALDATNDEIGRIIDRITETRPGLPVIVETHLRVAGPQEIGTHRVYRTTIAPLVRRLHDALSAQPHG